MQAISYKQVRCLFVLRYESYMKRHVILLLAIFGFFILVFFIQKIIFIAVHGFVHSGISGADFLQILYHGLSIDMSVSGYLTVIPFLFLVASVRMQIKPLVKIFDIYFSSMLSVIAIVTVLDVMLYFYWGFHPDTTILLYILKIEEVFASVSVKEMIAGTLAVILLIFFFYAGYRGMIRRLLLRLGAPPNRVKTYLGWLLLTGALFLSVRGGITVSTMNISRAYFSDRMFLNHAAVNPIFNFMYSLSKYDNFGSQYQFYESDEAAQVFDRLKTPSENTPPLQLLHTDRPNIILFLLESFSYGVAMDSVVAPNMCRLAGEGILFENFFANGFRTDRGLVSVLSGYPSHPTVAILKYPKKTETLPAIPQSLRQAGYANRSVYYGGDINFANMRSYLVGACGIRDIVSDKDFPIRERLTKWGAPDSSLFERVYRDLTKTEQTEPFLKIVLTLSSHEPFDVPTDIFDVPFLNSVNYTDDCIGKFVANLKTTGFWDNTLIILVADHAMQGYPQGFDVCDEIRFKVPMIWIGGAVKHPAVISDYGSQNDLAATLLSQLRIDPADFRFSKDMLHPQTRKFSFYSYVNGFCMMDSSSCYLYDNDRQKVLRQKGNPDMEKQAKAFFQMMYLDLASR
jgi:phosphoglycerol transferase MdoB-like AlkP superfamily enzyme